MLLETHTYKKNAVEEQRPTADGVLLWTLVVFVKIDKLRGKTFSFTPEQRDGFKIRKTLDLANRIEKTLLINKKRSE